MRAVFPDDWAQKYRIVSCLKQTEDRQTWLLEERDGERRLILKKASGAAGGVLEREYGLAKELAGFAGANMQYRSGNGEEYLLRDYVEGRTLKRIVEREGVFAPQAAAELMLKLCGAAALLHDRQPPVVHRDLKPENIVVTETGRIRLIDFETARTFKPGNSGDTVPMGTWGYAAPEQFGYGQTDERTDIFAMGKVLLFLLTEGCADADADSLRDADGKRLKKVILRCCSYNPDGRYRNVGELSEALQKFAARREKSFAAAGFAAGMMLSACVAAVFFAVCGTRICRQDGDAAACTAEENREAGAWNPLVFEENIAAIMESFRDGDYDEMAAECEKLVDRLYNDETVAAVEPVDYTGKNDEEMEEYNFSRVGYEFIADRLAAYGGIAVESVGGYGRRKDQIALSVRTCVEYSYVDYDGKERRSELYWFLQNGTSTNYEGCVIELLNCILQGLR